jgi:hypothetical protein
MSVQAKKTQRVEALRKSLKEASTQVQNWPRSKSESAEVTVDSKRLASYYESVLPTRKK